MGLRLRVLAAAVVVVAVFVAVMPASPASASGPNVHCVKPGETLWRIATYYGTSAYAIAHYNGLVNPNYIQAGSCLKIPPYGGYQGGYQGGPHGGYQGGYQGGPHGGIYTGRYCVRHGDTLFSIGRRFGVSAWAIARVNGLYNPNYIYVGQCLTIPPH